MIDPRAALLQFPIPVADMIVGAVLLGTVGGVVGLIVGLDVYPPTAWFAVFEIGIPAGIVGGLLGLFVGLLTETTG